MYAPYLPIMYGPSPKGGGSALTYMGAHIRDLVCHRRVSSHANKLRFRVTRDVTWDTPQGDWRVAEAGPGEGDRGAAQEGAILGADRSHLQRVCDVIDGATRGDKFTCLVIIQY